VTGPARWKPSWGLLAIALVVVAWAMIAQPPGGNQNSHYALTRAIASGTPSIDRTRFEVGVYSTGDISVYKGHVYSNKAPGLAFATLPAYEVLKAAGGAHPADDTTGQLWLLGLWSVLLPGTILLLLVRHVADELEPGYGTAAAVTLGLATLVLPFSTLFFSHIFSATLVFASYVALRRERGGGERLAWVAAGGFLAGFATTTEFPNAIAAAILGVYAVTRPGFVRRALAFGGGALAGIVPLLLFNQWAFGSPTRVSYQSTVGFGQTGSLFLRAPRFHQMVEILFGSVGMLRLTPVLALGAVGAVLLYRRGVRADALVIGAFGVAYWIFDACYEFPFGGASPGPRQMIPMIPFLAVPLAVAYRRFPLTTVVLAAVSAAEMIVLTVTIPLLAINFPDWFHRFFRGEFVRSALGVAGGSQNTGIALFFAACVLAVLFAVRATPLPVLSWRDGVTAAALFGGWLLIERRGPRLLNGDQLGDGNGAFTALLLAVAVTLAAVLLPRVLTGTSGKDVHDAAGGGQGPV
jgi:hypothetical protein